MELCDIATEQLEAELVAHAAWESRGLARFLDLLVEYDRRQAWGSWGCVSVQHWLSWKCGLATVAASERLRVAKAIQELPLIKQAFWEGHLSYSKVRELTRVATPETEQRWCEVAPHLTAGQLAKLVTAGRRATRDEDLRQLDERSFRWATNDDGGVTITVRLPADVGATVVAAVREATTIERGVKLARSQADAFVDLVLGRSEVSVEVVAHVSEDGHAILDSGNPISTELAECLGCDGAVTTVVDTPQGPVERDKRPAPNRAQRRFLQRRHPRCQFPGCEHAGKFEAHHVVERAKGGRTTLNNLVRLCWWHHRMVHLLGLVLTLHRDRTLTVTTADGRPIDRPIPDAEFHVDAPIDPNRLGGWSGQQLDLPYVVATVLGG
ncbi:MAG: DUF222 domain-containing protein [Actinomycetes bacterium]|jgi:hypothetical protein|uniref:Unannotated protein n=1 Tax=freshwater metagenome TaxID=449393 RepID=A0A6J6G0Z3_9ZZZZ|nr:DUF222 domain-containing protein [Actinomycetota bacterium]